MLMEVNWHSFSRLSSFHHVCFRWGSPAFAIQVRILGSAKPPFFAPPVEGLIVILMERLPGNKSGGFSTCSSLLSAPVLILSGILSSKPNLGLQAPRQPLCLFLPGDSDKKPTAVNLTHFHCSSSKYMVPKTSKKNMCLQTTHHPDKPLLTSYCISVYSFLPPLSRNTILHPTY